MNSTKPIKIKLAMVGFCMLLLVSGCKKAVKEVETLVPVKLGQAEVGNLVEYVRENGTIYSQNDVNVSAKIPGRVEQVLVNEGDVVKKGQVLFILERKELEATVNQVRAAVSVAESRVDLAHAGARKQERQQVANAVAQAKKAYEIAEKNFQRMIKLCNGQDVAGEDLEYFSLETASCSSVNNQGGIVSKQQLEGVALQFKMAKEQYDSAKQQMSLVEEGARKEDIKAAESGLQQARAALNLAEITLGDAVIYAPASGIVSSRNIEPGEIAAPGVPVITIVNNRDVYVEIEVTERSIERLAVGQKAIVEVDALGGEEFIGMVSDIVASANPLSRAFKVKIAVDNKDGKLKTGIFARVSIETKFHKDVVLIPREAVQSRSRRDVVFTVVNGKAKEVLVETGPFDKDRIIVTRGLNPGEKIVIEGQEVIGDGVKVQVEK